MRCCTESSVFEGLGLTHERIAHCWETAHGRTATGFGGMLDVVSDVRAAMGTVWETVDGMYRTEEYVRTSLVPDLVECGGQLADLEPVELSDPDAAIVLIGPVLRHVREKQFHSFCRHVRVANNAIWSNPRTLYGTYGRAASDLAQRQARSGDVVPSGARTFRDVRDHVDGALGRGLGFGGSWLDDAIVAMFAILEDNKVLIALGMFAMVMAYCYMTASSDSRDEGMACSLFHKLYTLVTGSAFQTGSGFGSGLGFPSPSHLMGVVSLPMLFEFTDDPIIRRLVLASDGSAFPEWETSIRQAKAYVDALDDTREERKMAQKMVLLAVRTESRGHLDAVLQRLGVLVDPVLDPRVPADYQALCAVVDKAMSDLRPVLRTLDAFHNDQVLKWTVEAVPTFAEALMDGTRSTAFGAAGPPLSPLMGALASVVEVVMGRDVVRNGFDEGSGLRAAVLVFALLMSFYVHPMMGLTVVACATTAYVLWTMLEKKAATESNACRGANPSTWPQCFHLFNSDIVTKLSFAKPLIAVAGAMWVFNLLRPLIPMDEGDSLYADHVTGMLEGATGAVASFQENLHQSRVQSNKLLGRMATTAIGTGVTMYTGNPAAQAAMESAYEFVAPSHPVVDPQLPDEVERKFV